MAIDQQQAALMARWKDPAYQARRKALYEASLARAAASAKRKYASRATPSATPSSALFLLAGQGTTARADIQRRYTADLGAGTQDAISRGLTGSTILSSMRGGAQRARQYSLTALQESLARQRLEALQQDRHYSLAQQEQAQQYALGLRQLNLQRRRLNSYGGYGGGLSGFQTVGSSYPLAGSSGALVGNRAYRRING